ncbi:MAG: 3-oxoacyl-ACP reductase [Planctomycetes bacterium RBG_13_46_10]|nr:MAG: 3-oxoacyl-ACP reductase [Planctomycetes bacterium RBG_13_46_10]
MNVFALENKLALITGGGTGLGKAIASCMLQAGAKVVILGRRQNILEKACSELGPQASFFVYDVTQTKQAAAFVTQLKESKGVPDIIVHNAGIHVKKPVQQTTEQELSDMLQTHVIGAYALTRALLPDLLKRASGHILFVTSMTALFGIPLVSAYTIAKSGIAGLVRSLATELSPHGIRVNAIAPGWIDTDMTQKALKDDPERKEKILSRTPLRTLGTPEDIGWAAVYLSSPAAKFITGQQLAVDGGMSIGF